MCDIIQSVVYRGVSRLVKATMCRWWARLLICQMPRDDIWAMLAHHERASNKVQNTPFFGRRKPRAKGCLTISRKKRKTHKIKYVAVCIKEGYLAFGENTHTLRLTSELVDLRVGYAKRIRRTRFAEPHLLSSVNMMHAVASYLRRVIEAVITRRSWNLYSLLESHTPKTLDL